MSLFQVVTLIAVTVALTMLFGAVLGSFFLLLLGVYFTCRILPRRWRRRIAYFTVAMSLLPWSGAAVGVMIIPGTHQPLPTLDHLLEKIPGTILIMPIFKAFYVIAEFPLEVLALMSSAYRSVVMFVGSSNVRPFVVFCFWFGLFVVSIASIFGRDRLSTCDSPELSDGSGT